MKDRLHSVHAHPISKNSLFHLAQSEKWDTFLNLTATKSYEAHNIPYTTASRDIVGTFTSGRFFPGNLSSAGAMGPADENEDEENGGDESPPTACPTVVSNGDTAVPPPLSSEFVPPSLPRPLLLPPPFNPSHVLFFSLLCPPTPPAAEIGRYGANTFCAGFEARSCCCCCCGDGRRGGAINAIEGDTLS